MTGAVPSPQVVELKSQHLLPELAAVIVPIIDSTLKCTEDYQFNAMQPNRRACLPWHLGLPRNSYCWFLGMPTDQDLGLGSLVSQTLLV